MVGDPLGCAKVTELVTTAAGHVVASLVPLHHHLAALALLEQQAYLQELQPILVTCSLMLAEQACRAELLTAHHALDGCLIQPHEALASLARAQPLIGVFVHLVENENLVVLLLLLNRPFLVDL